MPNDGGFPPTHEPTHAFCRRDWDPMSLQDYGNHLAIAVVGGGLILGRGVFAARFCIFRSTCGGWEVEVCEGEATTSMSTIAIAVTLQRHGQVFVCHVCPLPCAFAEACSCSLLRVTWFADPFHLDSISFTDTNSFTLLRARRLPCPAEAISISICWPQNCLTFLSFQAMPRCTSALLLLRFLARSYGNCP